ncbi:HAD family hydrolase [Thermodesulfobacteriota bacterium]
MFYQAFIFDFDGVLADSVEVKTRAFAKLFERYGPAIVAKVVEHHRNNGGMTRVDKFHHYYREFLGKQLDEAELQRLCNDFSRLVVDEVVSASEIPSAKNFLEKWYEKVNCFVVSATPDDEISVIVERRGLKRYFREIMGSSKSKQENVRVLMEKYGLEPARCVFFGDAESDYRAAEECEMDFVGIVPGPDAPLLKVAPEIRWVRDFVGMDLGKFMGRPG